MITKAQRNLLRVPGLLVRVPLVLILRVLVVTVSGIEWLCENVFKGLDR
jgi:hypothetical protein